MSTNTLCIIGVIIIALFLYYLLFIAEAFPGRGWYAFSIKEVGLKTRWLCFVLFIAAIILSFFNERLIGGILFGIALCLLILGQDFL